MRKFIAIALLFVSTLVSAQQVDEVIAKHFEAMGGKEKWASLESIKMTAKLSLGQGMEAPVTLIITNKPMNGSYSEFTIMGMTGKMCVTDKTGWSLMPFQGKKTAEPMPEDEAKQQRKSLDIQGPLFNYQQKGHTVEWIGKEEVDGTEVHKIKCSLNDKESTVYYYIDAQDYLLIKEESVYKFKDKEVKEKQEYSNYQQNDYGIMVAMTQTNSMGVLEIEKYECNVAVDPALFKMPAKN